MQDIDEMDFFYYMDILIYKAKQEIKTVPIDNIL